LTLSPSGLPGRQARKTAVKKVAEDGHAHTLLAAARLGLGATQASGGELSLRSIPTGFF